MLIAIVVLGALLFLFFEFIPLKKKSASVPPIESQSASQPVSAPRSMPETTPPGKKPESKRATDLHVRPAVRQEGPRSPIRIYFAFNRAQINKNVYCIFDRIQDLVRQEGAGSIRIVVEGNADSVGAPWYNVKLSRRRAALVADSLSRRLGIPLSSISLVANGSAKPIASNRTRAGRADNRRTDVIVYR